MAIYKLWDSHMHKKGNTVPPRQRHRQPRTWGPGRSTDKLSTSEFPAFSPRDIPACNQSKKIYL